MGIIIEDGTGNGYTTQVSKENKLEVNAVTQTKEHYINHHEGQAYNVLFEITPSGAGDCFFYMKNSSENDLVIEGIWIKLAANDYIEIKIGDTGTASGGTDVTPVNLNAGSGNVAEGTFQHGVDITGLSGGSTALKLWHVSSAGSNYTNFNQDVFIPKNKILSLYIGTGTASISGGIVFNYHDL
jgi:hypothetical protein